MTRINSRLEPAKALVVVAHWDDELISAWGAMCHYHPVVIGLTSKPKEPEFGQVFNDLVGTLGGTAVNWGVPARDHQHMACETLHC